jgi:polyhydroxyalkanoate synthesis regulator phasin
VTWTHAVVTLKPCQDLKVAAIRDAYDRRGLRVIIDFFNPYPASLVMAGIGDFVQKAFYLGVGIAASAGEKAGEKLGDVRVQAQKLADEMVAKGEITTEEARKLVDNMLHSAQQAQVNSADRPEERPAQPRPIEIEEDDDAAAGQQKAAEMRRQVEQMQAELERLKNQK